MKCRALVFAAGTLMLLGARPAGAQDVSGGYMLLHLSGLTFTRGWYADASVPVNTWWAIAGEVGAVYHTDVTPAAPLLRQYAQSPDMTISYREAMYDVLAGVRFRFSSPARIGAFAQVLAGSAHDSVSSRVAGLSGAGVTIIGTGLNDSIIDRAFVLQPGVGVTVRVAEHLGVRAQVDYRRALGDNGVRLAAGIAWRFRP